MIRSTRGALAILAALALALATVVLPAIDAPGTTVPTARADGPTSWTCSTDSPATCSVTGAGSAFNVTWTTPIPWAPGTVCTVSECPEAFMTLPKSVTSAVCTGGYSIVTSAIYSTMYWDFPLPTTTTCHMSVDFSVTGDPVIVGSGPQYQIRNGDGSGFAVLNVEATAPVTHLLTISSVTISPDAPSVSDDPITATVTVRNDTPDTITGVTAGLTSTTPQVVTAGGALAPPSVASLAPGASTDFTVALHPVAAGDASLSVTASATDGTDALTATPHTRTFSVTPAALTVALAADPATPHVDQATTITATLTNVTGRTVTGITSALNSNPTTADLGAPAPASIASLAPGASANIRWSFTGHAATSYALSAATSWTDPVDGSKTATTPFSLPVANDAIVVNSNGDAALTALATTNKACDTDDATAGAQCTLRAAIQLANILGANGTAQAITFDVPGAGLGAPTISPRTTLPTLTVPVTVDGTTQSFGWVELSGEHAPGDGLTVAGGASTIRGLVVNRFASGAGIVLTSAGGDTVVGNRIGTDVTGTAAVGNKVGIELDAPDALIGATTQASTTSCAGDCNLISGNGTGIAHDPTAPLPARSRIVGNMIGTDAAGRVAVGNTTGIRIQTSSPLGAADAVQIGGETSRPGFAPGNLISGNSGYGVAVSSTTPTEGLIAVIQGNIVGGDLTGTVGVLATGPDEVGVAAAEHSVLLGGSMAGDGNVIIGNTTGASGAMVADHNSIGVGLGGAAVANRLGFTGSDGLYLSTLCNNVVSGNDFGVYRGNLGGGNRIGTNAAGTAAIPNRIGVTGDIESVSIADCPGDGVDLVSGNTETGVGVVGSEGRSGVVNLSDIYIGTDISGTSAIPNGVGISEYQAVTSGTPVGVILGLGRHGESGRLSGCATNCVIVAGNRGDGISLVGSGSTWPAYLTVTNTKVGVGADGGVLGNGGNGIRSTSVFTNYGAGIVNSVISNNGGIGIDLLDSPTADVKFPVATNLIDSNAGGNVVLADGAGLLFTDNTIHDSSIGISVGGGTAPELIGNSFSGNTNGGYRLAAGTVGPGAPSSVIVHRVGTALVIGGVRASGLTSDFRIDVYGDSSCTAGAQGVDYLGSKVVPASLSTTFTIQLTGVTSTDAGIEVAATDLSDANSTTPGRSSRESDCVTAAATTQTASLSRSTADPGSSVTVTGAGFAPGEQVEVSLHSTPVTLATVTADASGAVSATVTIPLSTPAGLHHLVLTGLTSGVTVSSELTVTGTVAAATSVGALASTGTDASVPLAAAVALLALGAGALLLSARRRRRIRPRG